VTPTERLRGPLDHPQLLVSITNVANRPRQSCLLRLDAVTQHGEWIDVGFGQLLASGTGICADNEYIYHVFIANADFTSHLTIFDRHSLQVVHVQPLPEVVDGHSIVRSEQDLVVASTGTDQIIAYTLDGFELGEARVIWSPTDSGTDTHHINSLAVADGDLICSAFGPKEDDSWVTARNGYVCNISTDTEILDGLLQPHSAAWHDGQLFFCNSLEGSVNNQEGVVAYLFGYARGLTFGPDGTLYTATSLGRRPPPASEDIGVFGNPGDEGELLGHCALVQMTEVGTNRLEKSMATFGNEIYDIVVLSP
jgi:hypothetical protein